MLEVLCYFIHWDIVVTPHTSGSEKLNQFCDRGVVNWQFSLIEWVVKSRRVVLYHKVVPCHFYEQWFQSTSRMNGEWSH